MISAWLKYLDTYTENKVISKRIDDKFEQSTYIDNFGALRDALDHGQVHHYPAERKK